MNTSIQRDQNKNIHGKYTLQLQHSGYSGEGKGWKIWGGKYEGEDTEEVCSRAYNIVFLKKWRKFRSIYGKMLTSVKPGW